MNATDQDNIFWYIDFGPFNVKLSKSDGQIIVMWNKGDGTYPTRII